MELGHLLTRSGLTYPEVSSKVYRDSFCQLGNSVSLPWVTYFEAFYLHVVSSFSCFPVICPKLALFLTHLQFVRLFFNLSKYVLLFFSWNSSLLLLLYPAVFISNHFIFGSVVELFLPTENSQKISVPLMPISCFIKTALKLYVLIFSGKKFSIIWA
jgi:hypothetical protein